MSFARAVSSAVRRSHQASAVFRPFVSQGLRLRPTLSFPAIPVSLGARPRAFSSKSTEPPSSDAKDKAKDTPLTETVRDFLDPQELYELLGSRGMDFYTGVPDSLLKDFCAYVSDHSAPSKHVIAANEGAAVAIASGYHLATKKFPVVYMQNSGFGNSVNPLVSLADHKVYRIPMLLLIGWRGEPGKKDEPQHVVQGKIMSSLLADMNINFEVLPDYIEGATEAIDHAINHLETRGSPYALLVRRQCFTKYKMKSIEPNAFEINREQAIRLIAEGSGPFDIFVATTGFASRELYEYRDEMEQDHSHEFLTVGSMGHASAIAYGVAIAKQSRQVICIDGDGAALMHMGTMGTIGTLPLENYKHVLINNGAHDSVGGQPTGAFKINFCDVARAVGYKSAEMVIKASEVGHAMKRLREAKGPAFLEIRVNKGVRDNLGRPKQTPLQNKVEFMHFLQR